MNIKHDNYEIWAIDYLDGKLTSSEIAIFMAFLAENPDLSAELDKIRDVKLNLKTQKQPIIFNSLKKEYSDISINKQNFEEFCIAYYEGDLKNADKKRLIEYIAGDLPKQKLFEQYKNLRIQPDKSIVFRNKGALKQKAAHSILLTPKRIIQFSSSIAAAILILFILNYRLLNTSNSINTSKNTADIINNIGSSSTLNKTSIILKENTIVRTKSNPAKTYAQTTNKILISQELILEAVDTGNWQDVFIPISRIEISEIDTRYTEPAIAISPINRETNQAIANQTIPDRTISSINKNSQLLITKANSITLDAVFRKSIEGINHLVEAELKYNSETDSDGRITVFALSTERFNIKRKIKNN